MDTIVYVDGFNLYYRALKGTPHKWCDLEALVHASMPGHNVIKIKYFTARISGRLDPTAPARQHVYLRALELNPKIQIIYGNFLARPKWAGIYNDLNNTMRPKPEVVYVWKTEEKGSDVNLASHLLVDTFKGLMRHAAVLTNDSDLREPVRMVRDDFGLPVTLLSPVGRPSTDLVNSSTSVRHVSAYVGPCQLPNPVIGGRRPLFKPVTW